MNRDFSRTILLSCWIAVFVVAAAAEARPIVPAEQRFSAYTGILPACDDLRVLERIRDHFQQKESEYWQSGLQIIAYDRIRPIALRPWGLDHIPRLYCTARAFLNDSGFRSVSYSVGEDLGIIGWGFGVEWCVDGLDRNLAYAPGCKIARP